MLTALLTGCGKDVTEQLPVSPLKIRRPERRHRLPSFDRQQETPDPESAASTATFTHRRFIFPIYWRTGDQVQNHQPQTRLTQWAKFQSPCVGAMKAETDLSNTGERGAATRDMTFYAFYSRPSRTTAVRSS